MSALSRTVVITGPTATGKSGMALELARELSRRGIPPCIISMDSVQVYRYMDIGTDKLSEDEREGVPHHLIDVVLPDQTFSAAEFSRRSREILRDVEEGGGAAIIAGGTGFYLRALRQGLFPGPSARPEIRERLLAEVERDGLDALHDRLREVDPEAARRIHVNDRTRIMRALEVFEVTGEPISSHFDRQGEEAPWLEALVIGLDLERQIMYERINSRVERMMERGLLDEVSRLREMGYGPGLSSQQALGYRQAHMLLEEEIDFERAVYLIKRDTRHYARRQLTWLRKEKDLEWMNVSDRGKIVSRCVEFLEG